MSDLFLEASSSPSFFIKSAFGNRQCMISWHSDAITVYDVKERRLITNFIINNIGSSYLHVCVYIYNGMDSIVGISADNKLFVVNFDLDGVGHLQVNGFVTPFKVFNMFPFNDAVILCYEHGDVDVVYVADLHSTNTINLKPIKNGSAAKKSFSVVATTFCKDPVFSEQAVVYVVMSGKDEVVVSVAKIIGSNTPSQFSRVNIAFDAKNAVKINVNQTCKTNSEVKDIDTAVVISAVAHSQSDCVSLLVRRKSNVVCEHHWLKYFINTEKEDEPAASCLISRLLESNTAKKNDVCFAQLRSRGNELEYFSSQCDSGTFQCRVYDARYGACIARLNFAFQCKEVVSAMLISEGGVKCAVGSFMIGKNSYQIAKVAQKVVGINEEEVLTSVANAEKSVAHSLGTSLGSIVGCARKGNAHAEIQSAVVYDDVAVLKAILSGKKTILESIAVDHKDKILSVREKYLNHRALLHSGNAAKIPIREPILGGSRSNKFYLDIDFEAMKCYLEMLANAVNFAEDNAFTVSAKDWEILEILPFSETLSVLSCPVVIDVVLAGRRLDILVAIATFCIDVTEYTAVKLLLCAMNISEDMTKNFKWNKTTKQLVLAEGEKSSKAKGKASVTVNDDSIQIDKGIFVQLMMESLLRRPSGEMFNSGLLGDALKNVFCTSKVSFLFFLLAKLLKFSMEMDGHVEKTSKKRALSSSEGEGGLQFLLKWKEDQFKRALMWVEAILDSHFAGFVLSLCLANDQDTHNVPCSVALFRRGLIIMLELCNGSLKYTSTMEAVLGQWSHISRVSAINAEKNGPNKKEKLNPNGLEGLEELSSIGGASDALYVIERVYV